MYVQPYVFFNGRCEEAVQFYQKHLGAKVTTLMRYKDMPPGVGGPGVNYDGEKIMYGHLTIGDSVVMVSDDCVNPDVQFEGFSLSVGVKDEKEAERIFNALIDGGKAQMPLTKTFFSPCFGMAVDRFGMKWMVNVHGEP
jgi:PhnB protein